MHYKVVSVESSLNMHSFVFPKRRFKGQQMSVQTNHTLLEMGQCGSYSVLLPLAEITANGYMIRSLFGDSSPAMELTYEFPST